MDLLKITALLYVLVYYGVIMGYRSYVLYRKTGINPITNRTTEGLAGFIEKVFAVCFVLVSVIAFNYVFLEKNYQFLVPISYLKIEPVQYLGIVLSFSGLVLTFLAQMQMGDSWRLGLNDNEKTQFVAHGLYRVSRNPIYLGLLIAYLGFFLMLPNAINLCFFVVSYVALEVKIRLEEQYLAAKHADLFLAYKKKVNRWL